MDFITYQLKEMLNTLVCELLPNKQMSNSGCIMCFPLVSFHRLFKPFFREQFYWPIRELYKKNIFENLVWVNLHKLVQLVANLKENSIKNYRTIFIVQFYDKNADLKLNGRNLTRKTIRNYLWKTFDFWKN